MVNLSFSHLTFTTADVWLRGYVWIIMEVVLGGIVVWQSVLWFPHFHHKRSPLQWVYPCMFLSCVAFVLNGIGNTMKGKIPIAYELGVALIATGLSFIVFAWGLIVSKVLFALPSTKKKLVLGLVIANVSFYILLIAISIINYNLVIIPSLLFDVSLITLYISVSIYMKRVMTEPQLVLINKITRMADVLCAVAILCVIGLITFEVLIFSSSKHVIQTACYFRVVLFWYVAFTLYHLQKFAKARLVRDKRRRSLESGTTLSHSGSGGRAGKTSSSDEFDSSGSGPSKEEKGGEKEGEKGRESREKGEEVKEEERMDVSIELSPSDEDLGASTEMMVTSSSAKTLL